MRSLRVVVVLGLLSVSAVAQAQDRLFVDGREIGAIGRFGQPLGPAPSDLRLVPQPTVRFIRTGETIYDRSTGAAVWTPPAGEFINSWTNSADATRLFVVTHAGWALRLRSIDTSSGSVEGEGVAPSAGSFTMQWDPVGNRVLLWSSSGVHVYAADLTFLGSAGLGGGGHCAPTLTISEHTGRGYLYYWVESGYGYGPSTDRLAVLDLRTGRVLDDANLTENLGLPVHSSSCFGGATLWTAPGPPLRVAAAVTGREVTLSWLDTDRATGYVLDVGFAPGRRDATIFVGASTRVTFPDIPTGTYYVRVRAGNLMGGGQPSAEVRVVVP